MSKELEGRFQLFAKRVRDFCARVKRDLINKEYIKQVIRSSGSVSANYTEASDDLGKADEKMKLKISRREAKETIKWLDLIPTYENKNLEKEKLEPINEVEQIKKNIIHNYNKTRRLKECPVWEHLLLEPCSLCLIKNVY